MYMHFKKLKSAEQDGDCSFCHLAVPVSPIQCPSAR